MKSTTIAIAVALVILVSTAMVAAGQTLSTDKPDYPPGQTAVLTGSGFQAGEPVNLKVVHATSLPDSGADHGLWTVNADPEGNFVTEWHVCEDDCAGETLKATADGQVSGSHAEVLFTDSATWTLSISPENSIAGLTRTYTLTATNTTGGTNIGCIQVTVPVGFAPLGAPAVVAVSGGRFWTVSRAGNLIQALANSSGDRLGNGQSIRFNIDATAPSSIAGSPFEWIGEARPNPNCTGAPFAPPTGGSPAVNVLCDPPVITCPGNVIVSNDLHACSAVVSFAATAGGTPTPVISYSQNPGTAFPIGTTTVTVTATNSCGASSCSFTVTVQDHENPTITAPAAVVAATSAGLCEATGVALGAPVTSDNCPGETAANNAPASFPKGATTVTWTVTDAAGNPATATQLVTVEDHENPIVTLNGSAAVTVECHGSFVDPGAAAADNCDGDLSVAVSGVPDVNATGSYTIVYSSTDLGGNTGTASRTVNVIDTTPPTVVAPASVTATTGPSAATCGKLVDNGTLGTATAMDLCEGPIIPVRTGVPAGNIFPVGTTVVTYTATDPSGNADTARQNVTVVDDTPPMLVCPDNIVQIVDRNSCTAIVTYAPQVSDNCSESTFSCSPASGSPFALGTNTVECTAVDAAGNRSTCSFTVTVHNPAPVPVITGPASGSVYPVNTPVVLTGTFSDNAGDTHTARWTFDNIVVTAAAADINESSGTVTSSYTFTSAGVYMVTLKVADQCGGFGVTDQVGGMKAMLVIYDPTAGFVTGGGWFNSPAGAYTPNLSLAGRANFGFVSRYKKGATAPSGDTEFQYNVGNLNFHSTSYQWLVIAGADAKYKGSGTINDLPGYSFMLTARDGQIIGTDLDMFRMKIWITSTGAVVYDNQSQSTDDEAATTVLGGGSIVIHSTSGGTTAANSMDQDALTSPRSMQYALAQNSPNPFNNRTTISYALPQMSRVVLKVYDVLGREVKTLVDAEMESGWQSAEWHGDDNQGGSAPAGIYFVRMIATSLTGREIAVLNRRMMFLK